MSHWDFGRPPAGQHDEPWPSGLDGAARPPGPAAGTSGDGWPDGEHWPPGADGSPGETWPADGWDDDGWRNSGWNDDGWSEEEGTAPYPVTYERDPFAAAAQPAAPPQEPYEPYEPWPPAPYPGPPQDTGGWTDEAPAPGDRPWPGSARRGPGTPAPGAATGRRLPGEPDEDWGEPTGGGRDGRGGRRWLIPAAIVVLAAVGAATVLLTGGHPSAQGGHRAGGSAAPTAPGRSAGVSPGTPAPPGGSGTGAPLTIAQAQGVLGAYTTANNDANAQRSDTLLGMIETGSSYAIDAGLYQTRQAEGAAPYPAFSAVQATYYIPRDEPASGPRWFVVQVANAFQSNPQQVTSTEYLLFTQSVAGGAWQDAIEPYLLAGGSAPQVAVGADGLATAVSPGAASVAVAPGQLAVVTAASLDGTASGQAVVADPGNLADRADQRTWQATVPGGAVTDAHSPAPGADGQEFALLTAGGGALVFYTDAAQVTITPPAGSPLGVTVPGLYSSAQVLPQAGVSYLEQFAAYDPPAGAGAPRVVADYSAVTGMN